MHSFSSASGGPVPCRRHKRFRAQGAGFKVPSRCKAPCARSAVRHGALTNPYQVLGLDDCTVGEADIKRAYRRLALQHHPDVCKSANAEQKFLDIQQAYDLLINMSRGKEVHLSGGAGKAQSDWDFHDW